MKLEEAVKRKSAEFEQRQTELQDAHSHEVLNLTQKIEHLQTELERLRAGRSLIPDFSHIHCN